jgi:opacity protein-like surface antigen
MNVRYARLLVAASALVAAVPAHAEVSSPYVEAGAGINFMEALRFQNSAGASTQKQLNFNPGPIVAGAVGYAFGNGIRTEFELGYRSSGGKSITLNNGAIATPTHFNVDAHIYTYMVNALYDFDLSHTVPSMAQWTPHIGMGIGAANVNTSNTPSTTAFAFQPIIGIEYKFNPRLRFGLDYRYLGSSNVNESFTQNGAIVGRTAHTNIQDHAVLATLRWNFFSP